MSGIGTVFSQSNNTDEVSFANFALMWSRVIFNDVRVDKISKLKGEVRTEGASEALNMILCYKMQGKVI